MSNLFRSQSQQQKQEQQNNGNTFNRKNTVTTTTTKKTPAAAIYLHNEANFPEFISTKKDDVTDTKPNSATATMSMYANVVSAVINPTLVDDSTVPAGWTQITLDKKTHKMEVIESINFKKQKPPENTTNKIIKELDYRWYRYKVEYDLIHGENAFHEAHYSVPVYPYLDAELDTDSELSDHSNEYDTDL